MATAQEIQSHYDVDSAFYALFLDRPRMVYSCGVWEGADDLERAQENKLGRMERFAGIKPGQRVLDIGCGWGGMLEYALERYQAAEASGLTLSRDQYGYIASKRIPRARVYLESWEDWEASSPFDAIVSIGAFEHFASLDDRKAGRERAVYRKFFETCARLSTRSARLGLQTIVTQNRPTTLQGVKDVRYLLENVFPGSALPNVSDIQAAITGIYEIEELRTIGMDYVRTLAEWNRRLRANMERILAGYGENIFRHYDQYFSAARSGFELGYTNLVQISLRKAEHAGMG